MNPSKSEHKRNRFQRRAFFIYFPCTVYTFCVIIQTLKINKIRKMEVIVSRQLLVGILQKALTVLPKKPTKPILGCFLIEASSEALKVTASDGALSFNASIEAEVRNPGKICVAARGIYDFLREISSETVVLEQEAGSSWIVVSSDITKINLLSYGADDYPVKQPIGITSVQQFDIESFVESFRFSVTSVASEEIRGAMSGLFLNFEAEDHFISFVGTDLGRMSIAKIDSEGFRLAQNILVPKRAVQAIISMLDDAEGIGAMSLSESGDKLSIHVDNLSISTNLLDLSFPNYINAIPGGEASAVAKVSAKELISGLRVASVTKDKNNSICFSFNDSLLSLSSEANIGNCLFNIQGEGSGKFNVNLHCLLLLENLAVFSPDSTVEIAYFSDKFPVRFSEVGEKYRTFYSMPMHEEEAVSEAPQ